MNQRENYANLLHFPRSSTTYASLPSADQERLPSKTPATTNLVYLEAELIPMRTHQINLNYIYTSVHIIPAQNVQLFEFFTISFVCKDFYHIALKSVPFKHNESFKVFTGQKAYSES